MQAGRHPRDGGQHRRRPRVLSIHDEVASTRLLAAAVGGGWLRATGERRGRYCVLGPRLLATPAQGEIVSPAS